jgi:hypothetical protein
MGNRPGLGLMQPRHRGPEPGYVRGSPDNVRTTPALSSSSSSSVVPRGNLRHRPFATTNDRGEVHNILRPAVRLAAVVYADDQDSAQLLFLRSISYRRSGPKYIERDEVPGLLIKSFARKLDYSPKSLHVDVKETFGCLRLHDFLQILTHSMSIHAAYRLHVYE